jgi:hypothetical protein
MKDLDYFRRQFLLTEYDNFDLAWGKTKILNYNLFYHPGLEYEHSSNDSVELFLLGFLFDCENQEYSNKQILDVLSQTDSFAHFLEQLSGYSGHYIIIYKSEVRFILLNDACAQHEIYYDTIFSTFATQPKLLSKVIHPIPHDSVDAVEFYSSEAFLSSKLFIGETTNNANILHLLPNHYIDITSKTVNRFFPDKPVKPLPMKEATKKVCEMLRGYIRAAALRYNLIMGVTGGYDSRVLFLASLGVDCKYYVTKLGDMSDNHCDITIPQELARIFGKELKIIPSNNRIDSNTNQIQESSIDFPRTLDLSEEDFAGRILLNGNISEIARNRYGYFKKLSPEDLTFLVGYSDSKFVIKEYAKWIDSSTAWFSQKGYNILDMFYWEDRMGIWAAKTKTEMGAQGYIVYSPFCSHKLLTTLLSTPRRHRDFVHNRLYYQMFKEFSPVAARIPVNPSRSNKIKRLLNILKIYNLYRIIGLKYRFIPPIQRP